MTRIKLLLRKTYFKFWSLFPTKFWNFVENLAQIELGKGWDPLEISPEVLAIEELLERRKLANPVVFDVGANNGDWSLNFAKMLPESRIFTFEPSRDAFIKLVENTKHIKNIHNNNFGFGENEGFYTLYSDFYGSGMASLSQRDISHLGIKFEQEETIEVKAIDNEVIKNKSLPTPNIIKVDVEGHEFDVLMGARETLRTVEILQIEFGGTCIDTKTFFRNYWDLFKEYELEVFRLTPRGLCRINNYSERDEVFRFTNYFASKKFN